MRCTSTTVAVIFQTFENALTKVRFYPCTCSSNGCVKLNILLRLLRLGFNNVFPFIFKLFNHLLGQIWVILLLFRIHFLRLFHFLLNYGILSGIWLTLIKLLGLPRQSETHVLGRLNNILLSSKCLSRFYWVDTFLIIIFVNERHVGVKPLRCWGSRIALLYRFK